MKETDPDQPTGEMPEKAFAILTATDEATSSSLFMMSGTTSGKSSTLVLRDLYPVASLLVSKALCKGQKGLLNREIVSQSTLSSFSSAIRMAVSFTHQAANIVFGRQWH